MAGGHELDKNIEIWNIKKLIKALESAREIAVNLVIGKLIPLLRYEMTLLKEVHAQVAFIKDQLGLIRAYLRDADLKADKEEKSDVVKEWVKQVRDVAHRIEDVIDEYLLQVAERRQKRGLTGLVEKIARMLRSIEPRQRIASEIRDINTMITSLDKRKDTLGFNPTAEWSTSVVKTLGSGRDPRRAALFLDDAKLRGINETRKQLKSLLLEEDERRTIIAVVGTGGLGKTTITRKLYEKQKEKSFDCGAWVPVSSTFKEKKIFRMMLQSFYDQEDDDDDSKAMLIQKMNKATLLTKVREYLQEKRYIIVFDDVWAEDFWGCVELALPENKTKSRILVTTRHKRVAQFCRSYANVHIFELNRLHPSDAMELFLLKAFQFQPEGCPKELIKLSEEIVKKCDGVPLAIVAIASLLSTKNNNISEWQKVQNSLGSKLASDPHLKSFHQVLSESYHDLPSHLKPCLLYFGLFPDDYSISCARLIRLWIVEGLVDVKENENRTPEEVAEEYLDELICRSLVTVSSEYIDGRAKSCRVHDLLHDFLKEKCSEVDFCQVIRSENFTFNATTRRLSIQLQPSNEDVDLTRFVADHGRVRFCLAFNLEEMPRTLAKSFFSSFKLLVGLDFEDAPLDHLPDAVGYLLHLKYLNLKNTQIKTLPKFIGKLQKLQTLNVKYTQVRELPTEISKLTKLRHLLAYSIDVEIEFSPASMQGVMVKEGIGRLKALQKLSMVDMTNGDSLIKELKNLKQLRRLSIVKLTRHNGKPLCSAIEGMVHLQSLRIAAAEEHEILDLHSLDHNPPHQHLQRLYLHGRLETVPKWIPKLNVVVRLFLHWSGLMEDPLPFLKDLPELLELELYNAFEGDELYIGKGWFKKLKVLCLEKMQELKSLKIERGALPVIEKMTIGPCPQMVEVPRDIQNLQSLQLLRFYEMPVNPIDEKGYSILKDIPFVIYSKGNKFYTLHSDAGTATDDF